MGLSRGLGQVVNDSQMCSWCGKGRILYYVNPGPKYHLHTDFIGLPGKSNSAHGSRELHRDHSCVCWQVVFVCVCVHTDSVLTVTACLCTFLFVEMNTCEHSSPVLQINVALDHPQLQDPKIEPWSHPSHRSGTLSNSTPQSHTVSITWTLRIILWHTTRVCPLRDWMCSVHRITWKKKVLGVDLCSKMD